MWSFIIPAHNEERLLPDTLRALQSSLDEMASSGAIASYEIIVVNDASSDSTAATARELGARVVDVELRQIAAVRNAGAHAARGDVLVFIDADTQVTPELLLATAHAIARGAAGGGATLRFSDPASRCVRMATALSVEGLKLLRIIPGCYLFTTRAAFDAVGGFDLRYYAAEDAVISWALRRQGRVVFLREHVFTSARKLQSHSAREHLQLAWRFIREGRGALRGREHLGIWYDGRGRS